MQSVSDILYFVCGIDYDQLVFLKSDLEHPYNDWSDAHVAQGFAFRPGSVSFGPLRDDIESVVVVRRAEVYTPTEGVHRAIRLPFDLGGDRQLQVGGLFDHRTFGIDIGKFTLVCEMGYHEDEMHWTIFWILPPDGSDPAILTQDDGLNPSYPLLLDAEPA